MLLRDPRPEDVEARIRWVTTETAWGEWDSPWEGNEPVPPQKVEDVRRRMLKGLETPPPDPREMLYVELIGGPLLGWVNRYRDDPANRTTYIGVDLCEASYWGRGLGTEALRLWIDYLFTHLDLHRVGMETWSGNERMLRCALKCGFAEEGRFREVIEFQGRRWDGVKFGLLRREWEELRRRP